MAPMRVWLASLSTSASTLVVASSLVACAGGGSAPPSRPSAQAAAPSTNVAPVASPPPPATAASVDPAACEDAASCAAVGLALLDAKPGDRRAEKPLTRACLEASDADACAALLTVLSPDASDDRIVQVATAGCVVEGSEALRAKRAKACSWLAAATRRGLVQGASPSSFAQPLARACELGARDACAAQAKVAQREEQRAAEAASGVPRANVRAASLTSGGVHLRDVACQTEGSALGSLFATATAAAPFKERMAAISVCKHATGASPRFRWTARAGKIVDVAVVSGVDDKGAACLVRALRGATAPLAGTCAATLELATKP